VGARSKNKRADTALLSGSMLFFQLPSAKGFEITLYDVLASFLLNV